MRTRIFACALLILAGSPLGATEYFTTRQGNDAQDGLSKEKAFRTIQKGVDALEAGDTLTIGSGEYHEAVRRDGLGGSEAETVIRAEVPGTVHLRGDRPVEGFEKVEGTRFVYGAKFDPTVEVQVLNETDTLRVLEIKPNRTELEFEPGSFYQDREAGRLYLSTTDFEEAKGHRYTASVIGTHGLYLSRPKRVTIEGLTVSGFNASKEAPKEDQTLLGTWGIFLLEGQRCVVRKCDAYLNGGGIASNSRAESEEATGDNVIEQCRAWANASLFGEGDMGGITLYSPRRDHVRHSTAFLNKGYGINIYLGGAPGEKEENKCVLSDNLAWGNFCDFKIKTGRENVHEVVRCAGPGLWSVPTKNVHYSLIGPKSKRDYTKDNIHLREEDEIDWGREFADPENHDFRLQADSRYRGAGPEGKDAGPFPYQENIFYVSPGGDDSASGLSVKTAWKTLAKAVGGLKAGDTLYLLPGVYEEGMEVAAGEGKPIAIRGRGTIPPIIRGEVSVKNKGEVRFEGLNFEGSVPSANVPGVRFAHCGFAHGTTGRPAADNPGREAAPGRISRASRTLRLVRNPAVHSTSATTANIEWVATLPVVCEIAWGETTDCRHRAQFEMNSFGSYSLTGLKPGLTYYFKLLSVKVPPGFEEEYGSQSITGPAEPLAFTLPLQDAPPRTLYVAADGDNGASGLGRTSAWKTISHAAAVANVGDTVLIAGGSYAETVRIRATGTPAAPITFRALPGEKVVLNGAGKMLNKAILASAKNHLRFDGLYFSDFSFFPFQGGAGQWWPDQAADFFLYDCRDILITRCLSGTRGGYTATFVAAWKVIDLHIKNCLVIRKMTSMFLRNCPGLRVENTVFALPLITSFMLRNSADEVAHMRNNIFTDSLQVKASQNINLFTVDSSLKGFHQDNSCYFFRDFSPKKRALIGTKTAFDLADHIKNPIFADPKFAGVAILQAEGKLDARKNAYSPDALINPPIPWDFDTFFATDPELVKRGIGLQREAFADFSFSKTEPMAAPTKNGP